MGVNKYTDIGIFEISYTNFLEQLPENSTEVEEIRQKIEKGVLITKFWNSLPKNTKVVIYNIRRKPLNEWLGPYRGDGSSLWAYAITYFDGELPIVCGFSHNFDNSLN